MDHVTEPGKEAALMNLQAQAQNLIFSDPGITKDDIRQSLKAQLSFERIMNHCDDVITAPDEANIETAIMEAYALF